MPTVQEAYPAFTSTRGLQLLKMATERKLQFMDDDGNVITELYIEKAVMMRTPAPRLYIEPLVDDGNTVRLLWSEGICEDFSKVDHIKICRKDP
ncbi:MAG: hypothetical protein GY952_14095 [Rhodobacteraceae bacterium]|nr:hypothetical protein [Paracoccaceae bacterium]